MLPQRGALVLRPYGSALLEQRDDLFHEREDVAGPDPLADGEPVAADRVDGAGQLVGDLFSRAVVRLRIDADLADRKVPERRRPPRQIESIELPPDALNGARMDRDRKWPVEIEGREIRLQHRRERREAGFDGRAIVELLGPASSGLLGVGD